MILPGGAREFHRLGSVQRVLDLPHSDDGADEGAGAAVPLTKATGSAVTTTVQRVMKVLTRWLDRGQPERRKGHEQWSIVHRANGRRVVGFVHP